MKKILVIDDEKDFCNLIKENAQLIGNYEVITATNGKEGVRYAIKYKPDLILLDIIMPRMDGFEVLRRLKGNKKTMFIPVIILTAKSEDQFKIEAAGLYSEDYMVKPIQIKSLKSKIEDVFSRLGYK